MGYTSDKEMNDFLNCGDTYNDKRYQTDTHNEPLETRYQIYLDNTNDNPVLSFDEWLNS